MARCSCKQNNDTRLRPVPQDYMGKAASLAGAAARILQPLLATPSPRNMNLSSTSVLAFGNKPSPASLPHRQLISLQGSPSEHLYPARSWHWDAAVT